GLDAAQRPHALATPCVGPEVVIARHPGDAVAARQRPRDEVARPRRGDGEDEVGTVRLDRARARPDRHRIPADLSVRKVHDLAIRAAERREDAAAAAELEATT